VRNSNYDRIARYYDRIHHLFYGQSEINAQVELLDYVRPGDRVLIVGGGTGWILERIGAMFPAGLDITYIEGSGRMMELSKKKDRGQSRVRFVNQFVEDWRGGEGPAGEDGEGGAGGTGGGDGEAAMFDCILTGFFFDNFKEDHAVRIVEQLSGKLKRGGYWLEADFYYPKGRGKLWQAVLLYSMYWSARIVCGVEAKRLPDMERIFTERGYLILYTTFHYQRFIRSVVYRRS
jgi:SAM-dependent methyltransferase